MIGTRWPCSCARPAVRGVRGEVVRLETEKHVVPNRVAPRSPRPKAWVGSSILPGPTMFSSTYARRAFLGHSLSQHLSVEVWPLGPPPFRTEINIVSCLFSERYAL